MTTKIELLTKNMPLLGVAPVFMTVEDRWVLMGVGWIKSAYVTNNYGDLSVETWGLTPKRR